MFQKVIRCPRVCHSACCLESIRFLKSGNLDHNPVTEYNALPLQGTKQPGVGKKLALKHQIPTTEKMPG